MNPEIMTALNKYEVALRTAVREDTRAEMAEAYAPARLRALELAWEVVKTARIELEAKIHER